MENETVIKIQKRTLKKLLTDNKASAKAIHLVYVSDKQPGIHRQKNGNSFAYYFNEKIIDDADQLQRIRNLVIPPAWQEVWICTNPDGHLQVTGLDAMKRKQYRYHPLWNVLRNHTKFYHLYEFGKALPAIRQQINKDLSRQGMPLEKALAAVVSIMEHTSIRVGNNTYEKLYGSFGLTTLKNKHVTVNGNSARFSFKGKKGVYQDITLKSRKLAKIIRQCLDIPGKELFQYYDGNGNTHNIDSGMVNAYIKSISGGDFTAKDFRTWSGTLLALDFLKDISNVETVSETNKKIIEALDNVASRLGNTRTVCRKYYVHPLILDLFTNHKLEQYREVKLTEVSDLHAEENLLMHILEKHATSIVIEKTGK